VEPHHQFVLTKRLCQIDHLAETRARLRHRSRPIMPLAKAVDLLETLPGEACPTADIMVSEDRVCTGMGNSNGGLMEGFSR
jgi:hypothetical protein